MPSVWQILSWILALVTVITVAPARAQEVTVFDVRKNLPMSDDEPVYRDFYINAGSNAGIKSGMIITVIRKRALYDPYQNNNPSDLSVPVGELKVIHVQKDMSVARLHRTFDRDNMPILEFNFILVGDRLDLGTAHFGGGEKVKRPRHPPSQQPQRRRSWFLKSHNWQSRLKAWSLPQVSRYLATNKPLLKCLCKTETR